MTPILFSGLEALRDCRADIMFIGIRRKSFSLSGFDHGAPLVRGDQELNLYVNAFATSACGGRHVLLSRSIAQQMISSRRAVATTAIFRRVLLPRQT